MTAGAPHAVSEEPYTGSASPGSYAASLSAEAFASLGSMEGVYDPVVVPAEPAEPAISRRAVLAPGYACAAIVGLFAYLLHFLPVAPFTIVTEAATRHPISAMILAILLGTVLGNVLPLPTSALAGFRHVVKKMIPIAIVLTGAGLNFANIASVGLTALVITAVCIAVAIVAAYQIGRLLGLGSTTSLLIGVGTGICGNSAIVATAPLLDAEDDDVVLSIGTVNLFGLLAMLAWPLIGGLIGLNDRAFGVWSGTSIHAVPQVVAAGFAFSAEAGTMATLVKLVRVTLMAPMVFVLALLYARHHPASDPTVRKLTIRYARLVPWFVWGFVLLAVVNSFGLLPTLNFTLADFMSSGDEPVSLPLGRAMTFAAKLILTLAMAAIGLQLNIRALIGIGGRAVVTGLAATAVLGAVSLGMILIWL